MEPWCGTRDPMGPDLHCQITNDRYDGHLTILGVPVASIVELGAMLDRRTWKFKCMTSKPASSAWSLDNLEVGGDHQSISVRGNYFQVGCPWYT